MRDAEAVAFNRANWDERVPAHLVAYDVEGFLADPRRVSGVVREDLTLMGPHLPGGSPAGLDLVHLQCHIATDTLSWARLGARVTGVDFSVAATAVARDIAARAGLPATFLTSDIDSALEACPQRFDIVYTSIGVLPWLPDLSRWARVVAGLLRPGGLFFLRDSHPVLNALDHDRGDGTLALTAPYFGVGRPLRYDCGTSYADTEVRLSSATTYEWQHSLSEVVQALLDVGLVLTSLAEHRTLPWQALPQMVPTSVGDYALPEVQRDLMPLAFSVTATSPRAV